MNYIFSGIIIISLIAAAINGRIDETVNAALEGAGNSIEIILSFAGVMCMWSGFLRLAEKGGAMEGLSRLIRPVTKVLFPKLDKNSDAMGHISANISANLLGVGNAATPAGISAMNELDKINENPDYASDDMGVFAVMNTASLQLIPTTIIAIRASFGSSSPDSVIVPIWISSVTAFICAVSVMKLTNRMRKKRKTKHRS